MSDFDGVLDDVLRVAANPGTPEGLQERLMIRISGESRQAMETSRVVTMPVFGELRATDWEARRGSTTGAVLLHAAAMVLIALMVRQQVRLAAPAHTEIVTELATPTPPPVVTLKQNISGGGGGQKAPAPAARGHLPRLAEQQLVPPSMQRIDQPRLAAEPTIVVQRDLKMESSLPNVGIPDSPLVGTSLGGGVGTGIGSGSGSGLGRGSGGNTGGGIRAIGGGVSAPVLVYQVEPEFSEEARKAKLSGTVLVNLWVDAEGRPSHVHVLRGIGMGLDERAVAAVRQYRFKPALEAGHPVTVEMNVQVDFQIF